MENNRSYPDSYYNYGEYNDYPNYRHLPSSRNENVMPKETILKAPDENQPYYRSQENYQDTYSDEELWNMSARRAPNSSYTMFQPHKHNKNQSAVDSQMRNNLSQKRDIPLKGILVGGHTGINQEGLHRNITPEQGMAQERSDNNQRRVKSPQLSYRAAAYRNSNEHMMSTLCGGEPILDMEDSQYYLINDRKQVQPNYDNDKNMYDDYNDQTDDEISVKDENVYDYNTLDNEIYESSLHEAATFDPRERANKPFNKQRLGNNHCEKPESSSYNDNNENDYYIYQQRSAPSSSQGYNPTRMQNLTRNRNLMHPPIDRKEMYKQLVSEKLNETFNELKNAGLNEKKEEFKPPRNEMYSSIERYNYKELLNDNNKRSAIRSHLNKYKVDNDNEHINRRLHYPLSKTQDAAINNGRKISPEEQKFKKSSLGESGSFVHKQVGYRRQ